MNIKTYILTVLVLNVIMYLLCSFVQLSIDPSTWSESARAHFAVISAMILFFSVVPSIKG